MFKHFRSIPSKYMSREHFTSETLTPEENTIAPTAAPSESIVVQAAIMAANAADNVVDAASKIGKIVTGENVVEHKKDCKEKLELLKETHKEELQRTYNVVKNYEKIIIAQFVIITVILLLYIYNTYIKK